MVRSPNATIALFPSEPARVWWVGFTDVDDSTHWVRRLIGWLPPPRHVVAYRDTPGGLLVVQQTLSRLSVTVQAGVQAKDFTAQIKAAGGIVHAALAPADDGAAGWIPRPSTCVDAVRALLAMPWRPQTPAGLARQLEPRR